MKSVFSVLVPFTSELYPTLFRTLGYGCASGVGRIGALASVFVLFPLFFHSHFLPFLILFVVIFSAAIASYIIPNDTTNMYLD